MKLTPGELNVMAYCVEAGQGSFDMHYKRPVESLEKKRWITCKRVSTSPRFGGMLVCTPTDEGRREFNKFLRLKPKRRC